MFGIFSRNFKMFKEITSDKDNEIYNVFKGSYILDDMQSKKTSI